MAEESAVNYWEVSLRGLANHSPGFKKSPAQKYGHVAFDSSQKAVLTSCVLRYKPSVNQNPAANVSPLSKEKEGNDEDEDRKDVVKKEDTSMEEGFISCCFSFTIRRDKWGIPSMIVGNFIKC
jgi:hypothetical protein